MIVRMKDSVSDLGVSKMTVSKVPAQPRCHQPGDAESRCGACPAIGLSPQISACTVARAVSRMKRGESQLSFLPDPTGKQTWYSRRVARLD
jgi:hypothetical protein